MVKPRKEDRPFTGTEVGTLIKSLRDDISVVAEGVGAIRVDVNILKNDMQDLKRKMITVEDAIRISIPSINNRLSRLEAKVV
jgi:hypothetical protein